MQSSWQRIARETLRCSAVRRPTLAARFPTPRIALPNVCQPTCLRYTVLSFSNWRRTLATSALPFQQASTSTAPRPSQEPTPYSENEDEPKISPSRQALAAAKAIRLSVGSGNLPDAYLILNSIYYAKHDQSTLLRGIARILPQNAFRAAPIPFSSTTPTRLVTHTLLHSLVKNGYRVEASRLMAEFMENNIVIAEPALNAVYNTLTNPDTNIGNGVIRTRYFSKVNILKSTITEELIASEGGKHALRLLNVARESRQKRSLHLYKALIRLCIINGEIILASLVFGLLVRDWNACVVDQDPPLSADAPVPAPQGNRAKKLFIKGTLEHERPTPYPKEETLDSILYAIEDTLKAQNPNARNVQDGAIQALANLAALLDHRLLAVGPSPLIYLLSRINLKRHKGGTVWVPIDGEMRQVDAQTYFNDVLTRLCKDPPTIAYARASLVAPLTQNRGYMPALDVTGYKHLAFFALIKQRSYELAKCVVDHMRLERRSPLKADALMVERFKQAAVSARDSRFLKAAEFLASWNMTDPLPALAAYSSEAPSAQQMLLEALQSRNPEQIRLHLDSLVKNENWRLIHRFLPALIPGFAWRDLHKDVAAHYSYMGMSSSRKFNDERAQNKFDEDIRKAVANGPKLVTSVLTALHRHAKYDAADRVYVWAKQMEKSSWGLTEGEYASDPNIRPWTLPIAAYTVILRIRAQQIKSALREQEVRSLEGGQEVRPVNVLRRSAMRIYDQAMRARKVYGPRIEEAEEMGMGVHKHQELAIPDATFFNAILDIVRHEPFPAQQTVVPSSRTVPQAVERMESALEFYVQNGEAPYHLDKPILRVGRDMLEHGYPIPLGLRHLFVGNGLDPTLNDVDIKFWGNPAFKLSLAWKKRAKV
ncbi:hypothetical protein FA13DRAFT_1734637 [Coprinellus micaceus]|uniref:Uncharacterized protein n=1 Tax=Coprinellus micaceus TaxID=71717 RepID=A0A4Y7T5K6_COPMI|nr:hypothetical protein FA13DRAFT_1734637 [Coprinellus micaceus]